MKIFYIIIRYISNKKSYMQCMLIEKKEEI